MQPHRVRKKLLSAVGGKRDHGSGEPQAPPVCPGGPHDRCFVHYGTYVQFAVGGVLKPSGENEKSGKNFQQEWIEVNVSNGVGERAERLDARLIGMRSPLQPA